MRSNGNFLSLELKSDCMDFPARLGQGKKISWLLQKFFSLDKRHLLSSLSLSLPINGLWHLDENVVFMNHTPFPVFKRKAICISLSPIWNGFFYFTSTLTLVLLFSQIFFFKLLWTCIKCFRALAKCHSLGTFKREVGLTENKFPL